MNKFLKLTDIKAEQVVVLDNGFSCHDEGLEKIYEDIHGLYFFCSHGKHYLDGQCEFNEDGDDTVVGVLGV